LGLEAGFFVFKAEVLAFELVLFYVLFLGLEAVLDVLGLF
jgi:hypothetical protein